MWQGVVVEWPHKRCLFRPQVLVRGQQLCLLHLPLEDGLDERQRGEDKQAYDVVEVLCCCCCAADALTKTRFCCVALLLLLRKSMRQWSVVVKLTSLTHSSTTRRKKNHFFLSRSRKKPEWKQIFYPVIFFHILSSLDVRVTMKHLEFFLLHCPTVFRDLFFSPSAVHFRRFPTPPQYTPPPHPLHI